MPEKINLETIDESWKINMEKNTTTNNNKINVKESVNIIQNIVNRLSICGVIIKLIISVIISSLIISISILSTKNKINVNNLHILLFPYTFFILLDIYYLIMEKIFRKILHRILGSKFENPENINLNFTIKKYTRDIDSKYFIKSLFSTTTILFHGAMIMIILIIFSLL